MRVTQLIRSFKEKLILVIIIFWAILPVPASAVTVYVATDGTGDYNTDGISDQIEINQALSYIHSLGGGTVHLKIGTYIINDNIVVYDNTILEGDGWTSVIKLEDYVHWPQGKALIENEKKYIAGQNVNVTLRNFKVDGNRYKQSESEGSTYYILINFNKIRDVSIVNLSLVDNLGDQIKFGVPYEGAVNALIKNNYIANGGHSGLFLLWSDNITIDSNTILPRANAGIRTYGSNNVKIINNLIDGSYYTGEYGILIQQTSPSYPVNNILIKNNTIHDTGLEAIGTWADGASSASDATGIQIIGNRIYNSKAGNLNEKSGIQLDNFDNTTIENNVIYNNQGSGVRFYIYPNHAQVSWNVKAIVKNNIIVGNSEYGLSTSGLSKVSFINSYNDIYNNAFGNYIGASAGTGDISVDPLFAGPVADDFHLKSQYGRWTPTGWVIDAVTSPAIDVGDPTSDYSKEPTPNGYRINMGDYGNTPEASKSGVIDTGNITGTVNDTSNNPIPNATVSASGTSTKTNGTGGFFLANVATGTQQVTAAKQGYITQIKQANVTINSTVTLDFALDIAVPPAITSYLPTNLTPFQDEGTSNTFSVTTDQPVISKWLLDNIQQSETSQSFTKTWSYTDSGRHTISYTGSNTNGSVSQTWNLSVYDVVQGTSQTNEQKIRVYPNPYIKGESAGEKITFGNLPQEATIRIYTPDGKLVAEIEHQAVADGGLEEWDVSNISGGIYLYVITSSEGVKKGKVSVIK